MGAFTVVFCSKIYKYAEMQIWLSIIALFFALGAKASPDHFVTIDAQSDSQDITADILYSLQDPQKSNFESFSYTKIDRPDLNVSYSNRAYWIKLNLQNPIDKPVTRILYMTSFLVGEISLFQKDSLMPTMSGSSIPFDDKFFKSRLPAFKLVFEPFEKKTIYLKRVSQHSLSTKLNLGDQASFFSTEADLKAMLYFYAGGIFCLLLFNLLIGIYTRDKDFLFYSLFAGSVALTVLNLHGVLDSYLLRRLHTTLAVYLMCFSATSILTSLIFTNHLFDLKKNAPGARKVYIALGMVAVLIFLYGLIFFSDNQIPDMGYATDVLLFTALLTLTLTAIQVARRGVRIAKFFIFSLVCMAIGIFAYFGVSYGLFPHISILYSGLLFGNLAEMIVISLGLADKLNILQIEKVAALQEASEKKHYHRLVKVLSHDIANAIFIFSSYLERIRKRTFDAQDLVVVDKIESTLQKMSEILDSVRDEQTFKSFKEAAQLAPVNLNEVIVDLVHFYQDRFESKNLKVELTIDQKIHVLADRSALSNQVISNVISNSIKFSRIDGRIEIRTIENHDSFQLTIQDFGVGIPQESISRIFFSSTPAGAPVSTRGTNLETGSGFGASLVTEYMKLFGGRLEVYSSTDTEPTGTKITLIFPKGPQGDKRGLSAS